MTGSKVEALQILDRYLADLGIRGKAEELRLPAELLRRRISERLPQATARIQTRFVGREDGLGLLNEIVRQARAGHGAACLITGRPGIGKSRLAHEVGRLATLSGVRTLTLACQTSTVRRPMAVLRSLIPSLRSLPGAVGCAPESWQYLERWGNIDGESPLETPIDDSHAGKIANHIASTAARQAVVDLIDAVTTETPVLAVVDDVHWIDRWSAELLSDIIAGCQAKRIAILMTARRVFADGAALGSGTRNLSTFALGPLDPEESVQFLHQLVGDVRGGLDQDTLHRYTTLADGNPFYLTELAHFWEHHGAAPGTPPSLRTAISRRASSLSEPALRLLQACAILAEHATFARLERVSEYRRADLLRSIAELEENGLISSVDEHLVPRHAVVADAALALLPRISTRYLHRRVGLVLESEITALNYASTLSDCVRHFQSAGERALAMSVVMRCAHQLLADSRAHDALLLLQRSAEFFHTRDEDLHIREQILSTQHVLSDLPGVCSTAADIDRLRGDQIPTAAVAIDLRLNIIESQSYSGDNSTTLFAEAFEILLDFRATASQRARAGVAAIVVASALYDHARMKDAHEQLSILCQRSTVSVAQRAMGEVVFHCDCGDLERAVAAGAQLVQAGRESGSLSELAQSLRFMAKPLRWLGSFEAARNSLTEALEISLRLNSPSLASVTAAQIVRTYIDESDFDNAKKWISIGNTYADPVQHPHRNADLRFLAAVIAMIEGDFAQASELQADLHPGLEVPAVEPTSRAAYYFLSIGVLADILYKGVTDLRRSQQLLQLFNERQGFGDQDIPAYCVHQILMAEGRSNEAQHLLAEYALHRRERSPIPVFVGALGGKHRPRVH